MKNEDVEKVKKPIFKKWWFWLLVVIALFIVIGAFGNTDDSTTQNQSNNEITVYFNKLNNEEIVEVKVKNGELLEEPVAPIKEGATFSHWATHDKTVDGSERFDFNTPITKSIRLFAHYENTYIPSGSKLAKENYDKITNGMTKDQVVELLGNPTSTSENDIQGMKTEVYHYQVSTLTGCQIYFSNGKVSMKNWTEL